MKYYQFIAYRDKITKELVFKNIEEKEFVGTLPVVIEDDKITALESYYQDEGKVWIFICGSKAILEAYHLGIHDLTKINAKL